MFSVMLYNTNSGMAKAVMLLFTAITDACDSKVK